MNGDGRPFAERFAQALKDHLARPEDEAALNQAYELGREAPARGLGILDIVRLYRDGTDEAGTDGRAGDFLAESLSAFEMQVRGYRETIARLQQANLSLERAKGIAEEATRAKSTFLSRMSHELRTPLNAVLGFAQLLTYDSAPMAAADQQAFAEQILQAGRHLLSLIDEILDLAKIESGAVTLSIEPIALGELLLDCRRMIEPLAKPRAVGLVFPVWEDLAVRADRIRLRQVLLNLLSNAVKYNREGGSVTVSQQRIGTEHVRIAVRDSGPGLTEAQIASLYQPFNRLGQELGSIEGSGIGLVVTKHLVELMGGTIGVSSVVGIGSTFWIEFGLAEPAPRAEPSRRAALRPAGPSMGELPLLLYVEDNPANLQLVEHIVKLRGNLRLISAIDGRNGIELARQHLPNVILMDLHLPGIDGYSAFEILSADPRTAHIPVIALSASAMPRDVKKGLAAGFFGYVTKPIEIDSFNQAIESALLFATRRRQS